MIATWDKSLETGFPEIDRQHQEFFRRMAILSDAFKQCKGIQAVNAMLDFLEGYVAEHFAEEEQVMDEVKCPVAAENRLAHARFFTMFHRLRREFNRGSGQVKVVLQLHEELAKWMVKHIQGVDRRLHDYCNKSQPELAASAT